MGGAGGGDRKEPKFFEKNLQQKIKLVEFEVKFSMTGTSIGIIFRLSKTFFTHFDSEYDENYIFVTQNRKLLNVHQKYVTFFIKKNTVNKVCI